MSEKLTRLVERRNQLVAQAAVQRAALAHDMAPWRARLEMADRGVAMFRYLGRHPALMAGTALLVAALRPLRIGKWLQRGWVVCRLGRRLLGR